MTRAHVLPRSFYARSALVVAPDLLGKILVSGHCAGRIVETEAYMQDDRASHSFRGPRLGNKVMFGPPGHLYVYFIYGMHFCANVVTGEDDVGEAVLIRALEPLKGMTEMRMRRPNVERTVEMCNGPGKLTRALGIGRDNNGADLLRSRIRVVDDGVEPPMFPDASPRIGITEAVDYPWRWSIPNDPHVSKRPRPGAPDETNS
jgi:DNA-3-methyladenine glycosylase